jgi:hypothetical protein
VVALTSFFSICGTNFVVAQTSVGQTSVGQKSVGQTSVAEKSKHLNMCRGHLQAYFHEVYEVFMTFVHEAATNTGFVAVLWKCSNFPFFIKFAL